MRRFKCLWGTGLVLSSCTSPIIATAPQLYRVSQEATGKPELRNMGRRYSKRSQYWVLIRSARTFFIANVEARRVDCPSRSHWHRRMSGRWARGKSVPSALALSFSFLCCLSTFQLVYASSLLSRWRDRRQVWTKRLTWLTSFVRVGTYFTPVRLQTKALLAPSHGIKSNFLLSSNILIVIVELPETTVTTEKKFKKKLQEEGNRSQTQLNFFCHRIYVLFVNTYYIFLSLFILLFLANVFFFLFFLEARCKVQKTTDTKKTTHSL